MGKRIVKPEVVYKKCKSWAVCTPEEEKFCDYILSGMSYAESVYEAGLMSRDTSRSTAQSKANRLLQTKRCAEYIRAHKKTAVVYTPNDFDVLATHMYEIGMGRATRVVKKQTEEGIIEVEETPSFRDQTAAATWVLAYMKLSAQKVLNNGKKTDLKSDEIIDAKAQAFLSKWKTRDIDMGSVEESRKNKQERKELVKILGDDTEDAEYEEALNDDQSDYRI